MVLVGGIIGYQIGFVSGQKNIIYRISKTMKCIEINEEFNNTIFNGKPIINLTEIRKDLKVLVWQKAGLKIIINGSLTGEKKCLMRD